MAQRKRKLTPRARISYLFRQNEWLGLALLVLGATSSGLGLYFAVWFALRPLYYRSITYAIHGAEWMIFPLFFGLGSLLWVFGKIELRSVVPADRERALIEAESVLSRRSNKHHSFPMGQLLQGLVFGLLVGILIGWLVL